MATIEAYCRKKAQEPSKSANVAQVTSITSSASPDSPPDVTISAYDYHDFLQFQAAQQSASPITIMAQSSNLVAFISQSPSLGPWILDSGASNHMTGNQSLFTQLSLSDSLRSVTLADGSQIKSPWHWSNTPTP